MRTNDTQIFWPHVSDFVVPIVPDQDFTINLKLVGNHCNMRCTYCYAHDAPPGGQAVLSPDLVATLIARIPDTHRLRFLLHGGEPLLYPRDQMAELLSVITARVQNRHDIRIQSNGTLLDDDWIDLFLSYCPEFVFSLSLDSLDEGGLRRLPGGGLGDIMRGKLALLQRRGVQVGIVATASRSNRANFPTFIEGLTVFGVRYLTINRLRMNRGLRSGSNAWGLSEIEFVDVLDAVLHHWIEGRLFDRIQIQPLMSLLMRDSGRLCTFVDRPSVCSGFLSLYPDGRVTICDHFDPEGIHMLSDCVDCPIHSWCGSGCYGEKKDKTFCQARFRLKSIIEQVLA